MTNYVGTPRMSDTLAIYILGVLALDTLYLYYECKWLVDCYLIPYRKELNNVLVFWKKYEISDRRGKNLNYKGILIIDNSRQGIPTWSSIGTTGTSLHVAQKINHVAHSNCMPNAEFKRVMALSEVKTFIQRLKYTKMDAVR